MRNPIPVSTIAQGSPQRTVRRKGLSNLVKMFLGLTREFSRALRCLEAHRQEQYHLESVRNQGYSSLVTTSSSFRQYYQVLIELVLIDPD